MLDLRLLLAVLVELGRLRGFGDRLAGPGGDTRLRMVTLVDDDGEGHIELVHVVASASLVQAVEHHLGKRRNSTSSDFE